MFRVRVPKNFTDTDEMIWTLTTKGKTEKAYATTRTDYKIDDVVIASETGALGAGTSSPEMRANKRPVVKVEGEKKRTAKVGQPIVLTALVTDDGVPRRRGGQGGAGRQGGPGREGGPARQGAPEGRGAAPSNADPGNPTAGLLTGQNRNPAYNPPSRITVGKANGLHVSWFVYRGAEKVTFDPPQVKTWEDTRAGANSPWAPLWQPPAIPADNRWTAQAVFAGPGTYVLRARADDGALYADEEITVTVTR
jgi:hypothetical protein